MTREEAKDLIPQDDFLMWQQNIIDDSIDKIYNHFEQKLKDQEHKLANKYQKIISEERLKYDELLEIMEKK